MPDDDAKMTGPLDLPMQPTGSGVADLEIAREQDALAADGDLTGAIDAEPLVEIEDGPDQEDSAAHPS
jgi:hypothetical protein